MTQLTDRALETSIARMLAGGVILSSIAVLAGGVLYLKNAKTQVADYTKFHAAAPSLRTVDGVLQGVLHVEAESIIQLGLLLLIATPIVRVIFCVVGFSRRRDWLYTAVSLVVLAILVYSLARGAQ